MIKDFFIGRKVNLDPTVEILNSDVGFTFEKNYSVTDHELINLDTHKIEFIHCNNYIIINDIDASIVYFGKRIYNSTITEHEYKNTFDVDNIELDGFDYFSETGFIECHSNKHQNILVKIFKRPLTNTTEYAFTIVEYGKQLKIYLVIEINNKSFI